MQNQQKHGNGTITVDVLGRVYSPGTLKNSDCLLWAVWKQKKVIAYDPIWVVIPWAIGRPHPEKSGNVGPVNQCASAATSPAYFGALGSGQVVLWTYWAQWLAIPVVDQFFNSLDSIYNGQEVYENDSQKINQRVSGGVYQDPVFAFVYKNGTQTNPYIVASDSSEAIAWPSAGSEPFPAGASASQDIRVKIAGFEIGAQAASGKSRSFPAIHNRKITTSAPSNVSVTWP